MRCNVMCCAVWTHLSSVLVFNLSGQVWVEGVLGAKVLQVLTVGQVIAHIHVQQQGGLVGPGGGGGQEEVGSQ